MTNEQLLAVCKAAESCALNSDIFPEGAKARFLGFILHMGHRKYGWRMECHLRVALDGKVAGLVQHVGLDMPPTASFDDVVAAAIEKGHPHKQTISDHEMLALCRFAEWTVTQRLIGVPAGIGQIGNFSGFLIGYEDGAWTLESYFDVREVVDGELKRFGRIKEKTVLGYPGKPYSAMLAGVVSDCAGSYLLTSEAPPTDVGA